MRLTAIFKKKMRKSTLISELSYKIQVSYHTVERWIKEDIKYDNFTQPKHMDLLKQVSMLKEHEIIEADDL
jgi:transposase